MKNRFVPGVVVTALMAIPAFTNGCSSADNIVNSVCCTDYKPGGDMTGVDWGVDASISGEFSVFAQAASDFSASASALANDVEASCKAIAVDLGEDPNGAANANQTGSDAVAYWCNLAAADIGKALGNVTLNVDYQAPKCEISVSANADCEAKCSASAKCDYKLHPPVCTGGTLTVDCSGSCDVTVQEPKIQCEGSCKASCEGSCQGSLTAKVDCDGTCDGTCSAGGQGGGSGIQADGTCKGQCAGKCTTRAGASVSCSGTCSGTCSGQCKATPGSASVKCSGKCNADYTPLTCTGGKLEGGCEVSADCQAHCNASLNANANCTAPQVRITTTGTDQLNAVIRTLEANLPNILLAFKTRGQEFVDAGQAFVTSAGNLLQASGKLGVKGTTCGVIMSASVSTGLANAQAAFNGSTSVAGKLQIK